MKEQKETISYFRFTRSAIRAIEAMDAAFLKEFKRKSIVSLYYGEYWVPHKYYPERYVVGYFSDSAASSEIAWFRDFLKKNDFNQGKSNI